jgi:V/A-type H+-transporting ATPase subunit C
VDLIELGTSRNLARDYRDILSYCEGELRELVAAYLTRWDVQNLKTIIRGKYYGATREEIQEDLVPAGRMGEQALSALLAVDTIPEVLEEARKRQNIVIPDEVMRSFEASKNLAPLEDYLDKWNYANLLEMVQPTSKPKRLLLAFIRREIDVANLRTLLRLKLEGMPADKIGIYLIPGGAEMKLPDLQRLAASESFNQMVDDLSKY